jgi:predicted outer membrane repeat protein
MKRSIVLLTLVLTLLAAAFNVRPAFAANAVVGSGTAGSCTEAAFDNALTAANSGGGTITFNCGAAVTTISFTSQKSILASVTINGNDLIILNGGSVTRHFFVNGGLTFRLQHIVLRDGDSGAGGGAIESSGADVFLESVQLINNYAPNQGGAVYCYVGADGTLTISDSLFENNVSRYGGAIYNDGCVTTISNSTFKTNQANNGVLGNGGAIYNSTPFTPSLLTLTVNNSLFQGNSALFDGGGLYNDAGATAILNFVTLKSNTGGYGGGLENNGTVTLNDSLVDSNSVTGSGGGIWNLSGTVNLVRTQVTNNSAYEGGGINSYGTHVEITNASIMNNVTTGTHGGGVYISAGTAFITNATISGNHAVGGAANGGGVYHNSNDNLTMTNVTLVNNQADSLGGGLYHYGRYAVLTNVTIGNNTAAAGSAIYEDSPNSFLVQLKNSVLFGSANNCDGVVFDSLGYNLSQGACSSLVQPSDQNNFGGNLNLSTLAYNGGTVIMQTMAPLAGSPLIDAVGGGSCPATDQRGGARPVGAACDIGAVEYGAVALPSATVLVNSVLPTSRSVPVAATATIFNTVINAGATTAYGLTLSINPAPAGTFVYQQTDCATNAIIGLPNPSLDLAPGGVLCYVLSFTPSAVFAATHVHIRAQASNAPSTNLLTGINTWLLRATSVPGPDIIALTTTTDFHQVACSGINAFAVALSNVGVAATSDITVLANTGSATLPLSISISETNPGTGAIIGDHILQSVGAGANRTVAVFVTFNGCVNFDPAANRIFIEFRDASNNVVGSTSTAVSTGR